MTSYVSEALSGLSGEVGNKDAPKKANEDLQQQHHAELIDQVLAKTKRIQREMRGRKYRVSVELYGWMDRHHDSALGLDE